LVIPQLLFPIIASLVLNKLLDNNDPDAWKKFKWGSVATAAIFAMAFIYYFNSDFTKENTQRTAAFNRLYSAQDPAIQSKLGEYKPSIDNQLYEGMISNLDRKSVVVGKECRHRWEQHQ